MTKTNVWKLGRYYALQIPGGSIFYGGGHTICSSESPQDVLREFSTGEADDAEIKPVTGVEAKRVRADIQRHVQSYANALSG